LGLAANPVNQGIQAIDEHKKSGEIDPQSKNFHRLRISPVVAACKIDPSSLFKL